MKKAFVIFLSVFLILNAICSCQVTSQDNSVTASNTAVSLAPGVWPQNEYTEGLPSPPGTVSQASLDTEKGYCSIFLTDITDEEYQAYLEKLGQNGFQVVEEVSEEVAGQDYVSIGILVSDGTRGISLSYLPNQLNLYISTMQK